MSKITVAALLLIAFGSASASTYPVVKTNIVKSDLVVPLIGLESVSEVGSPIYRHSVVEATTTYRASPKHAVTADLQRGMKISFAAGRSEVMKTRGPAMPMVCIKVKWYGPLNLLVNDTVQGCLIDTKNTGSFDAATFPEVAKYFPLAEPVEYEVENQTRTAPSPGTMSFELLYQGMSKGDIKIAYREYVDNLARPAFNQDLSYELDKSGQGVIAFKGIRIRVLEASGERIRYIVDKIGPSLI